MYNLNPLLVHIITHNYKITQSNHLFVSVFADSLSFNSVHFLELDSKPKGKGAIHDKYWRHEQKHIKLSEIVLSDTLRSPWTVMVIPFDAYITINTVKGTRWHVELTFAAETIL
jgi:hypothetical protein